MAQSSRRSFLTAALVSPLIASCVGPKSSRSRPQYTNLKELLTPIREKSGLPAVAAGVIKQGWLLGLGAVGVRKMGGLAARRVGDGNAVTSSDKFHIGSCTKAMTA